MNDLTVNNSRNDRDWLVDGAFNWTSYFQETTSVGLIGEIAMDERRESTVEKNGARWIGAATVDETKGDTIGCIGESIVDEIRGTIEELTSVW